MHVINLTKINLFLFQCNSEVVTPTKREDHVEPESGIRYTDASVDITRDQVEHYNGEFHCSCVVITKKGAKVSKTALVTTACKYLNLRLARY